MQYCSLQHQTLLPSPITTTTGWCFSFSYVSSLFLELFLHWSPVAFWAPTDMGSSSFSVLSFCLFILFMGFSRQEYWSGLPLPSPVNHVFSELSTMTCPSWVALHGMANSFNELDKAVVHVISLVSFLWLCFFCVVFVIINEETQITIRNEIKVWSWKKQLKWIQFSRCDQEKESANFLTGQMKLYILRRRKKTMKKPTQTLGDPWDTSMHMYCRRLRRGRERGNKNIWRNNSKNLPKCDKTHESPYPRSSRNSKKDKFKNIHPKIIILYKGQENLESRRREVTVI